MALPAQTNRDLVKTLNEIERQLAPRANLLDQDATHVSAEELLATTGLISEEADKVIDALVRDDNYRALSASVNDGSDVAVSLGDLARPSPAALAGLRQTLSLSDSLLMRRPSVQGVSARFQHLAHMRHSDLAQRLIGADYSNAQGDLADLRTVLGALPNEVLLALNAQNWKIGLTAGSLLLDGDPVNGLTYPKQKKSVIAWPSVLEHERPRVAVHEALHAYHLITNDHLTPSFLRARHQDLAALKSLDESYSDAEEGYMSQANETGKMETYGVIGSATLVPRDPDVYTSDPDEPDVASHVAQYFKTRFAWPSGD